MTAVAECDGPPLLPLRCIAIRAETPSARSYDFARSDGAGLAFDPGQFLNLVFRIDGCDHLRSYSISSSAARADRVSITVKRVAGGRVSNWLFDHLRVGDTVAAMAPAGAFCCGPQPGGPLLFLTAGSGITPAASMLRSMIDHGAEADLVLIHFADRPEEMIFHAEMAHWARHLPRARIVPVVTRPPAWSGWVGPVGRLSGSLLHGLVPDLAARRLFCCGPAGFMEQAVTLARAAGLPDDRIITESFDSAAPPEAGPVAPAATGFAVSFARSGRQARIAAEGTVLQAAKAAEVRIVTSCNKGVCGTCRVKLLSGTVEIDHKGGIRQREIDQGFILACCSRPRSDLVIDR